MCVLVAPQRSVPRSCAETDVGVVTVSGALPRQPKHVGAAVPAAAASTEGRRAGAPLASGPMVAGEAYRGVRIGAIRAGALGGSGVRWSLDTQLVSGHRRLLSGVRRR